MMSFLRVTVRFIVHYMKNYINMQVRVTIFLYRALTHFQLNHLSHCHPSRHQFTSSELGEWLPMKTALFHSQIFGSHSTNQGRLAAAPDPVSGHRQPITEAPAHLMHRGPLACSRQAHISVDPHTGAVDAGHCSDRQPIKCIVLLSDT